MTNPGCFPKFQKFINPDKLSENARVLFNSAQEALEDLRKQKEEAQKLNPESMLINYLSLLLSNNF